MSAPDHALRYAVDRLVMNRRRIFGWGWATDPTCAIEAASLEIVTRGSTQCIPANVGLARPDVAAALPDWPHAGASGFVVTGYLPDAAVERISLRLRLEDGREPSVELTPLVDRDYESRRKRRAIKWAAQALWRRLRRFDLQGLLARARAQDYALRPLGDRDVAQYLTPLIGKAHTTVLVLDHNMGGGANQYREALVAQRAQAGDCVLLCTYNLPTLDYRLHVIEPGKERRTFRLSSFTALEPVLEALALREIFLNSPVSFDEPLLLAEWLASMRVRHPATRLTLTMHDYLAICPSFVLLNERGRYCGVPDVSVCESCLARHGASYVTLSPPTRMAPWRAVWGRCLGSADEVRCFSESTRTLLLRAYPALEGSKVTVVPHRVDYAPARAPLLDHRAPLTIGVLGQISVQKGAGIVKEMMAAIERQGIDARLVVLGTLDLPVRSSRLLVTGPYRRDDLVELIEAHGINVALFPSICPETFSYTIEEMTRLGLPIVAFDLGAPGERLRRHPRARLVSEVSAAAALTAIVELHAELAGAQPIVA